MRMFNNLTQKASGQTWKRQSWRPLKVIFPAFIAGWNEAVRMPGILAFKWCVNGLLAGGAMLAFGILLRQYLAHSALQELSFGKLRADEVLEFLLAYKDQWFMVALSFFCAGSVYLCFNLYLTGGVLEQLRNGGSPSWARFFKACNHYLWKLLLIAVLECILFFLLIPLPNYALYRILRWIAKHTLGPMPLFWAVWVYGLMMFLLVSIGARVYDYARIALFLEPHRGTLRSFARAVVFTLRFGMSSLLLWTALIVTPLLVLAAFTHLTVRFEPETMLSLGVYFILGQVVILIRIAGGVAALGAQMRFMQAQIGKWVNEDY